MIRDLGGSIGVRSALGIGSGGNGGNVLQDVRLLQQNVPHILCGTPQKLHTLFTAPGGISGADVRMLVLDEVDQLIARNLHEFVLNIVKLLPPPRSRPKDATSLNSPGGSGLGPIGSIDGLPNGSSGRRFSSALISPGTPDNQTSPTGQELIERQTALFSNTVPQDVLNLANTMQLKEPVRVLVRRDGGVTHSESGQTARGLRQFYLYLAFTGGGRKDAPTTPGGGLGIIGSGRGTSNPETAQAREWKLDALADLFEDLEIPQAIVHVGGMTALDSVVYKLANRGLEAIPLVRYFFYIFRSFD
jgi:translation initiation factor 4A